MARPQRPLSGKVVAITGGARGIGRATAAALAREGCRVAIGDLDAAAAEDAAAEIGAGCVALALDVTDPASFEAFLDRVESELGPLDVGPFVEEDEARQRRQVDINLHGPMRGTKLALRRMVPRRRGHIVNVASSASRVAPPGIATYAATKHGVQGFTEAVRTEQRGSGVDFSYVMPGVVNTEMIAGYESSRGVKNVEPEDVAAAIVDALKTGRVEVFVPRSLGPMLRVTAFAPRPVREWLNRVLKVDRITWNADRSARAEYDARAAASQPGLSGEKFPGGELSAQDAQPASPKHVA
jgi:NAD(P)-dependent dehydrogenase (short-subunit alcohol dehydrogenase family)